MTNSQEEALSISDRIILLNEGHIEQSGAPEEVYRRPVSEFSARFMGECNILPYDIILKTLRVPETERSKVIYQCYGPEHKRDIAVSVRLKIGEEERRLLQVLARHICR